MSDSGKGIFLSYASQDAEIAQRICDAMRAAGLEVWFDRNELVGGDAWDAKIRRQIKECALFVPLISPNTNARAEGYFRREWKLAVERTHDMADDVPFLLPIIVGDLTDASARVPDKFREVQWTRLRLDETPTELAARAARLLGGPVAEPERARSGRSTPPLAPAGGAREEKPKWLRYAWSILGLVLVAFYGLRPFFRPERPKRDPQQEVAAAMKLVEQVTPTAANASPAPAPEIDALLTRARSLFDGLDAARDDFKFAGELIAKAKARDDYAAKVWAAEAQLHSRYIQRGWDASDERREAARQASRRALQLDAQEFEARFAAVLLLADDAAQGPEKERRLRELRAERPKDQRVLRALGTVIGRQGRVDEANAINDESAALPGGDPLALYDKSLNLWFAGRTVEAEQAVRASLAQRPFVGAQLIDAWLAVLLHGDTGRARRILDGLPAAALQEDRAAYFSYFAELCAGRFDAAIARVRDVPRDWFNDSWYRGPKAQLIGDAHAAAGRRDAAELEWREALRLVEARLAAGPPDPNLQYTYLLLLAKVGDRAAAEREFATLTQRFGVVVDGDQAAPRWVVHSLTQLGRKAEALRHIALGLRQPRRAVDYTVARLQLDPMFAPLRTDPGFAAVVEQARSLEEAAVVAATPPRDWPKNPELKRAIGLLDGLEAIPEDIRLAEQIAERVLEKNPTDPEAVTAMARVHSIWLLRGWDRSTARYQKAKSTAERALQLAPDEPEAHAALAIHLYARGAEPKRAVELAQRAVDLCPQEARFHRIRDNCLWAMSVPAGSVFMDKTVEAENEGLRRALDSARRTIELFPRDPLVRYELSRHYRDIGRWEDFERLNDEALALAPVANAMVWKARARFGLHGDLPGMKAVLDQVPSRVRGIERTVFAYFLYAAFTGQAEVGLEALNGMTETWMIDFDYRGPKSLLTAALLERSGKREMARVQYAAALEELQRSRSLNPEDSQTYLIEAWIKHALGRPDEARAALRIFNESLPRPYLLSPIATWWFQAIAANLLMGEKATALTLMRECAAGAPLGRTTIRTRLAGDPRLAQFRDDPEVLAALAEPAAGK